MMAGYNAKLCDHKNRVIEGHLLKWRKNSQAEQAIKPYPKWHTLVWKMKKILGKSTLKY